MTLSIKYLLENKNGEDVLFYPITHEHAVYDSDGISLDNKIKDVTDQTNSLTSVVNDLEEELRLVRAQVNSLVNEGLTVLVSESSSTEVSGIAINANWPWLSN